MNELYLHGIVPFYENGVLYFFAFLVGAAVGSFLNVFIYRWPREMQVFNPRRSFCPSCHHVIPWYWNIPLVSWLLLRGRCRWCGARIPLQYVLVEAAAGLWFVASLWKFGPTAGAVMLFLFGAALLAGSVIDLQTRLLPDVITLGLVPAGLGMALAAGHWSLSWPVKVWEALIGGAAGAGLFTVVLVGFKALTGREGMGWGDVKLMASLGVFLGYPALPAAVFLASAAGIVVWLVLKVVKKVDRQYHIPFGPLLSAGALTVVMTREWLKEHWIIIDWHFW